MEIDYQKYIDRQAAKDKSSKKYKRVEDNLLWKKPSLDSKNYGKWVDSIKDYILILNKKGNVLMSAVRYCYCYDMLPNHSIKEVFEYDDDPDLILIEKV